MHAKHSSIYDRCQCEVVEDLTTVSPYVGTAILSLAFIVEPVHLDRVPTPKLSSGPGDRNDETNLSDLSRLMVSTDECYSIWIADFEGEKEKERLYAVEPPVDEVSCTYDGRPSATENETKAADRIGKLTHKQVVRLRAPSSHFEKLHQVEELSVYVTTNLTRGVEPVA